MQVIDEISREQVNANLCRRVIVDHIPDQIIYGYVKNQVPGIKLTIVGFHTKSGFFSGLACMNTLGDKLFYGNRTGQYFSKVNCPEDFYLMEKYTKGRGAFPYNFERRYEAIESFNIFKGKQELVIPEKDYPLSHHLKYTFGLEFETSMGYIPEHICMRDGLIPLRDGSISGLEYSTVVLNGNFGLGLLEQQCETLKKYTTFNKECSLHVHLGNFPLDPGKLFKLYTICFNLQGSGSFTSLLPKYTFNSAKYKESGKDYCKKLPQFESFNDMYRGFVGRTFYGDLTQPHPNDPDRSRKWNIVTRYFWVNFINILCYNINKTIEFRFLRPTFNYRKITVWLYIMNAILRFAEDDDITLMMCASTGLKQIVDYVYQGDSELQKKLKIEILKLELLNKNQTSNGDKIGADLAFEEELFDSKELL